MPQMMANCIDGMAKVTIVNIPQVHMVLCLNFERHQIFRKFQFQIATYHATNKCPCAIILLDFVDNFGEQRVEGVRYALYTCHHISIHIYCMHLAHQRQCTLSQLYVQKCQLNAVATIEMFLISLYITVINFKATKCGQLTSSHSLLFILCPSTNSIFPLHPELFCHCK